jgi:release factor glutamine methyltransferase
LPVSAADHRLIVEALRGVGCVFAEDEARLLIDGAADRAKLDAMVNRRVAGLPLEQVLGWAEFRALRIAIDAGVFVPRRRSEFLVEQAISCIRKAYPVVVDLCCGSGALGVAIAAAIDGIELHAADLEPAAVDCARRNVGAIGGRVYAGDLYDALPVDLRGRIDVLVANTPYVPTEAIGSMPPEARFYEPRMALDGGPDGLDVQRRLTIAAPRWLAPGGHLLVEVSKEQAPDTVEVFERAGLRSWAVSSEEYGATVVIGSA